MLHTTRLPSGFYIVRQTYARNRAEVDEEPVYASEINRMVPSVIGVPNREQKDMILLAAIEFFGREQNFFTWLNNQNVNAIRHLLLADTLHYLYNGMRKSHISAFSGMIAQSPGNLRGDTKPDNKATMADYTALNIKHKDIHQGVSIPADTLGVIATWTKNDDGYVDLWSFLRIMHSVYTPWEVDGSTSAGRAERIQKEVFHRELFWRLT